MSLCDTGSRDRIVVNIQNCMIGKKKRIEVNNYTLKKMYNTMKQNKKKIGRYSYKCILLQFVFCNRP